MTQWSEFFLVSIPHPVFPPLFPRAVASGIQLTTRRGPYGSNYAVGGSIKVDMAPVPGSPRATLDKAQAVLRAAFAPGNPSAADMRVAAEAYR
ncbi:MAG: hypothetical protein B6241_13615, partial [Spirochaetaceae bacterium 4572_59]